MIISHRGNLNGPDPTTENTNEQINKAINAGFYVEVDVWGIKGELWLGHDRPIEKCKMHPKLIYHCKDIHAAERCGLSNAHFFMHEIDKQVLTSEGYFWTYPGYQIGNYSIACLPELKPSWDITKAAGVCTDYPIRYRDTLK
jgi:glycerophosphoryl diester phosphodiesterase